MKTWDYDITFCEGEGCILRDNCHRYLQLLRFRADTDPNRGDHISILLRDHAATEPCSLFWRENNPDDQNEEL